MKKTKNDTYLIWTRHLDERVHLPDRWNVVNLEGSPNRLNANAFRDIFIDVAKQCFQLGGDRVSRWLIIREYLKIKFFYEIQFFLFLN